MQEKVINLIKEEIENLNVKIKEKSKALKEYESVYTALKPNKKAFKKENVFNIIDDEKLIIKITNLVSKSDLIAIESMLEKKKEFDEFDRETTLALKRYGLTKQLIYSDQFINYVKAKTPSNPKLEKVYNELLEMKRREIELFKQNEEIVMFICNTAINMYEKMIDEKESLKHQKKGLNYALDSIRKEEMLLPWSVNSLEEFLDALSDENQDIVVCFLQSYNQKIKDKKERLKDKKEQVVSEETPKYVFIDDVKEEQIINPTMVIAKNYLDAIKGMNRSMINQVLEQLSLDVNFISIINHMINFLDGEASENELQGYLEQYLDSYLNSNIEYKEDFQDDNDVLYYGFAQRKNYILNDLENIPTDYYKDVLKAIEKIKRCNLNVGVKSITDLKKVFEIRVNKIRVTCKRFSKDTYVIIGIYCKKSKKDRTLINDTAKKSKELEIIFDAMKIDYLWDKYMISNKQMEDDIYNKINSKIK